MMWFNYHNFGEIYTLPLKNRWIRRGLTHGKNRYKKCYPTSKLRMAWQEGIAKRIRLLCSFYFAFSYFLFRSVNRTSSMSKQVFKWKLHECAIY